MVVFGKEGCHRCDEVEREIRALGESVGALTVVDIEKDRRLQALYWMRGPVGAVGGREVFEASMMDLDGRWRSRLPVLLRG